MRTNVLTGSYSGLLFIGDPHVSSRRPGRRQDDYLESVLTKLSQAASIANEHNLLPVITGDLIHRAEENSMVLVHRLLRVLKTFHVPPIDVEGNHGKSQADLTVGDIELLLHDAGVLRVVSEQGLFAEIDILGRPVQLFACPHGEELPQDLKPFGASERCTKLLVAHHDLAFEGAYPDALLLHEIRNCDAVVNGHMHKTSPCVQTGQTIWHCPGNIEPLSVDVRDHKPAVWEWQGDPRSLKPHWLTHDKNCFNMTGLQVAALPGAEAVQALPDAEQKDKMPEVPEFLAELQAQEATGAQRTDDASIFEEDVEEVLKETSASEAARMLMRTLVSRVKTKTAPP